LRGSRSANLQSRPKTVAKNAEEQRRRELEAGFHNLREVPQQRIRRLDEIVDEYLVGYRLRYRSAAFAEYALGHVSRLLGPEMIVDIDEAAALRYQEQRLREKAAPKTSTKLPRRQLRGAISAEDAYGIQGRSFWQKCARKSS
jgi:hypothetical protein